MKHVSSFVWLAAASMVVIPLAAEAKLARSGSSDVSFTAVGPGGLKIVGTTPDLQVADDAQSVNVIVHYYVCR